VVQIANCHTIQPGACLQARNDVLIEGQGKRRTKAAVPAASQNEVNESLVVRMNCKDEVALVSVLFFERCL